MATGSTVRQVQRLVGRYDLIEQVASGKGRALWRGHDVVLDRPVGILMLDRDHPHATEVRAAALRAARIEHPSILRVVDADLDDGRVLVVTRWLIGATLADQLAGGPLPPLEAARVTRDMAGALTAAAAEGVHHLVLDPRDVLLTDHGVVLVGVGVRAALAGVNPEGDPYQVDAWRLGAILYAALTARWPGEACAGLPAAPMVAGQLPRPRQVRAGVPVDLDDIAWRALHPSVADSLATPQAVAEALDKLDGRRTWPSPEPVQQLPWRAVGIALVFMLVLAGAGLVGWQVWQDRSRTTASDTSPTRNPDASGAVTTSPSAAPAGEPLPIGRAQAFDPSGDGEENDEEAPLAIDGNPATAWRTLTYASRDLGQLKPGVGLQLKLSGEQAVGGIELELVGRGTDLQIWAQRDPTATPTAARPLAGFRLLTSVPGAGDQMTYRFEPAVQTEVVVVWLTALPTDGDGYQGGVADVALLS